MFTGRENQPIGKPKLYIHSSPRKDGKYKATYCFTGRKIGKILSQQQVQDEIDSNHYAIIRA